MAKKPLPRHNMAFLEGRRLRRLRRTAWMRDIVRETRLTPGDLIWPLFIEEGKNARSAIKTMPGVERLSIDLAVKAAKEAHAEGIPALALFPNTPDRKRSDTGAEAYNPTTNTWAAYNMPTARALHSATVLGDGRVVVCGGAQGTLLATVPIANVDVFTPATNSWSVAPALTSPRASHVANLLPDGTLILFGGQGSSATLNTIETLRF